ncbi:hypothetical protein [Priestia megaterium]|uniref:hypothetical protein n=1 Tax=Priestia megaterium TaxID=1404 RepID=UPI001BE8163B|nr:hypothetical protein [Priestia megaterium]MBT2259174.1 hypothetical protein [Priestia megaterium]MBT2279765.1 hypothetical protein [Priestia megaterium]
MTRDTKAARILSIVMLAIVVIVLIMTEFVNVKSTGSTASLYYAYSLAPIVGLLLSLFGTKGKFRIVFSLIFLAFIVWFYVVPAINFLNGDF